MLNRPALRLPSGGGSSCRSVTETGIPKVSRSPSTCRTAARPKTATVPGPDRARDRTGPRSLTSAKSPWRLASSSHASGSSVKPTGSPIPPPSLRNRRPFALASRHYGRRSPRGRAPRVTTLRRRSPRSASHARVNSVPASAQWRSSSASSAGPLSPARWEVGWRSRVELGPVEPHLSQRTSCPVENVISTSGACDGPRAWRPACGLLVGVTVPSWPVLREASGQSPAHGPLCSPPTIETAAPLSAEEQDPPNRSLYGFGGLPLPGPAAFGVYQGSWTVPLD